MDLTNLTNPTLQLCISGTQAEYQHRPDDARARYQQAWASATDDYEACIAAHYVARFQDTPVETFQWNQKALNRANAINDDRVKAFYPSLYVNMGHSYELIGDLEEAKRYYELAAALGLEHHM